MALTVYNTAATSGHIFSLNAVTGIQVTTLSLAASPVTTETGYDPSNGAATLFGVHDGEVTTGTISGRIVSPNGVSTATIGSDVSTSITPTYLSIAGYTGNTGKVVCTSLSVSASPGAFRTLELGFSHFHKIA